MALELSKILMGGPGFHCTLTCSGPPRASDAEVGVAQAPHSEKHAGLQASQQLLCLETDTRRGEGGEVPNPGLKRRTHSSEGELVER